MNVEAVYTKNTLFSGISFTYRERFASRKPRKPASRLANLALSQTLDKEIEIGDGLSIRSILPTSITSEDITRLVEHHFDVYRSKESFELVKAHYSCRFLNNPAGGAIISVVQNDEGKIVGAYGGIPLRLKLGENSEISYLICCDSVSPQFTGSNLIRLFP